MEIKEIKCLQFKAKLKRNRDILESQKMEIEKEIHHIDKMIKMVKENPEIFELVEILVNIIKGH